MVKPTTKAGTLLTEVLWPPLLLLPPPQRSEEYGAERLWETEVVEFSRWRSQWTSVLVPSVKPQNIGIIF